MKQISTLISIILIALCPLTMAAQETEQVQETAQAQQRAITGTLIDKETKEAIMQVTD